MKYIYTMLAFLFLCQNAAAQTTDVYAIARSGTLSQAMELYETNPGSFSKPNADGYTPLILACYRGNNSVAKFLTDKKAAVNYLSGMGTALMAAVAKGNDEMVKYLLSNGADANVADANGSTALIYATMFKQHDNVAALIRAKADPTHKDGRGNSAMDYAILADDDQLIQTLKSN